MVSNLVCTEPPQSVAQRRSERYQYLWRLSKCPVGHSQALLLPLGEDRLALDILQCCKTLERGILREPRRLRWIPALTRLSGAFVKEKGMLPDLHLKQPGLQW